MKDPKNALLTALITGAICVVISFIPDIMGIEAIGVKAGIILGGYAITILCVYISSLIWEGWMRSRFDLWNIGKIRGLWQDKGLKKQLKKNFETSQNIKIKVTRGKELLNHRKPNGLVKELSDLKDGKGKTTEKSVNVQILLVLPCYQDDHVKERREAHNEMDDKTFLESWYQFLDEIREYDSEHLSINVRFYRGTHARWRFYIFEKERADQSTCVLLSNYDRKREGLSLPMYKIMHGEQNIAGFMCKYFDDLWENKSTIKPQELYKLIETKKCQSQFCLNCDAQGISQCDSCGREKCEFENLCQNLIKRYKEVLMSFGAGGEGEEV